MQADAKQANIKNGLSVPFDTSKMSHRETLLKNTLYPKANFESVMTVVELCKQYDMDPFLKPFHIIKYGSEDKILPGIGFHRNIAERSNTYLGMSDIEFGPMITKKFKKKEKIQEKLINRNTGEEYYGWKITGKLIESEFTFPEYCKVKLKKLVGNRVANFVHIQFFLESYATESKDSEFPNEMWQKMPHNQLLKCTEAGALRRGWSTIIGAGVTYEEIEGKWNALDNIDIGSKKLVKNENALELGNNTKQESTAAQIKQKVKSTKNPINEGSRNKILFYYENGDQDLIDKVDEYVSKCKVKTLFELFNLDEKYGNTLISGLEENFIGLKDKWDEHISNKQFTEDLKGGIV